MVGEYTEMLVLNWYIYKFSMILILPISHRDYGYLKYWSLTDIRFFTALISCIIKKKHTLNDFLSTRLTQFHFSYFLYSVQTI
ncbi:hypothetical protein Hanom_Chr17g01534881 [Helianthus anomalus]